MCYYYCMFTVINSTTYVWSIIVILETMAIYQLVITLSMPLEPNVLLNRQSTYTYLGPKALEICQRERQDTLNTITKKGDKLSVSQCQKVN